MAAVFSVVFPNTPFHLREAAVFLGAQLRHLALIFGGAVHMETSLSLVGPGRAVSIEKLSQEKGN